MIHCLVGEKLFEPVRKKDLICSAADLIKDPKKRVGRIY